MKRNYVIGLVLVAAAIAGCGSSSGGGGGGVSMGVTAGSACNAASKQVTCATDKTAVLSCNGTTYQVATACAANTQCDSGTSTCKSTGAGDTTSDTSTPDTTTPDVSVVDTDTTTTPDTTADTKPDTTPVGGDCEPTDEACVATCQEEKCADEIAACQDDPGCVGLMQCISACKDTACQETCIDEASPGSAQIVADFSLCVQTKCFIAPEMPCDQKDPDFQDCLNSCALYMCLDEIKACDADPACGDSISCAAKCDTGACQQKCFTDAGASGAKGKAEMLCVNDKCVAKATTNPGEKCDPNDQECLQACNEANCSEEYGACTSNKDCMAVLQCATACGETDEACFTECLEGPGGTDATAWLMCVNDACF